MNTEITDAPIKILAVDDETNVITALKRLFLDESAFLSKVKTEHPETLRIMLTGHASLDSAIKVGNNEEIYRFFTKLWNEIDLQFAVRAALEKFNLEDENRRLLETIKNQALELKLLEKKHPGISKLERDEDGHVVLDDISSDDLAELSDKYNIKFRK